MKFGPNFENNFSQGIDDKKPEYLYHGSQNRNITKFEPRAITIRNESDGEVVFATPDAAYASMFIVPVDDSWAQIAIFGETHCIVISDKERFMKYNDKGGAIYKLPADTFKTDQEISRSEKEWTSKDTVDPRHKTNVKNGLKTMIRHGVQVYFVDKQTLENIKTSEDHGIKILKSIQSENQKLGRFIKEIED